MSKVAVQLVRKSIFLADLALTRAGSLAVRRGFLTLTLTLSHSPTLSHSLSHSLYLCFSLSLFLSITLSLFLSLSLTLKLFAQLSPDDIWNNFHFDT